MKQLPMERKNSALVSKDYKTKFGYHKRMKDSYNRLNSNASASTNFDRDVSAPKMHRSNTYNNLPNSSRMMLNSERTRMTSGYYNILAHDNNQDYKDSKRQQRILTQIKDQPKAQKVRNGLATPMTPDNNIVFINRDAIIRRPREFKTPPPPMYGEEMDYDYDKPIPKHEFYNPVVDPHKRKFDFLDSREGTVSNHYQKYIDSKTFQRPKKPKRPKNYDSYDSSEVDDTINDLPTMEIQNHKIAKPRDKMYPNPYKNTYRASLNRGGSYSPNSIHNSGAQIYRKQSALKANVDNIMAQTMYKPQVAMPAAKQAHVNMGGSSRRQIRSGAFQRLNSTGASKLRSKY